ncbi:hypothetical protein H6G97_49230 [Nostoc flagelliforme FACHB-838]|uniref:Transposase n=1 Tax=Nostoc flagelliforme FACHB-838 TaxID=2692904 RepID=A0ABR8E5K3_9NOSO|nr:hypothetical protein [Nostoc flagelliforme]MBD2536800.1 hypothetical protein [Nostoc flagelliforme FACHB-838]
MSQSLMVEVKSQSCWDEHLALVGLLVESDNDATLVELCVSEAYRRYRLEQQTQVKISRSLMGRITQKLNLTRKKKHYTRAKSIQNGCKN